MYCTGHQVMITLFLLLCIPRGGILAPLSSEYSWLTSWSNFPDSWSSLWLWSYSLPSSSWSSDFPSLQIDFCNGNHFTCSDGSCIPLQWECDWYNDCPDNTDEHAHCNYQGDVACVDNKTVPSHWICDGFPDCFKGEDEDEKLCATRTSCTGRLCDNNMKCVEDDEVCNGVFDCIDRTDEDQQVCDTDCFLCDNGALCIYMSWRCDGIADCHDISDESNRICGPVTDRCSRGAFPCKHNLYCVPQHWRCDGENDCGDLSDELNCDKKIAWIVNQGWTEWSPWSECSAACDDVGIRSRSRTCRTSNPLKTCNGHANEKEKCKGSGDGCPQKFGNKCGVRHTEESLDTRVVGGKVAVHGDWPWQAQLIWMQDGRKFASCGGTLIHPKIVVGAAHCFMAHMNDRTKWLVHLGKHGINTNTLFKGEVERRVSNIEVHPGFNTRTLENDIVILVLDWPVVESPKKHIRWACLDEGIKINRDTECFVSGWGVTEMGGSQAQNLKEAPMPILNRDVCNKADIYGGLVRDSMICAGHMKGGIDACQGDSGGPLTCKNPDDGLWYLVGITSWGHGCAMPRRPGIFTKVSAFNDWILEVVGKYI